MYILLPEQNGYVLTVIVDLLKTKIVTSWTSAAKIKAPWNYFGVCSWLEVLSLCSMGYLLFTWFRFRQYSFSLCFFPCPKFLPGLKGPPSISLLDDCTFYQIFFRKHVKRDFRARWWDLKVSDILGSDQQLGIRWTERDGERESHREDLCL